MDNQDKPLRLAVSACLLGQPVRYDGAHKHAASLELWPVQWHPICPEVAVAMGVPRPPIEQRYLNKELMVVTVNNWQQRHHSPLADYASQVAEYIKEHRISGYVLMQKSPSCALQSSPLYNDNGAIRTDAEGYFVAALRQTLPQLPMIEEAMLADAKARQAFLRQAQHYAAVTYPLATSV